jgi:signal peptidase II
VNRVEPVARLLGFFALAAAVVAGDQVTKLWAVEVLEPRGALSLIPGFFDLVCVRNRGVAFGLFNDGDRPWQAWVLGGFALAAMLLILRMVRQLPPHAHRSLSGFALIFGGAAGNLLDRIRHGEVIDFVYLYYREWHWPAFNVADSAICVGVGLLLLDMLKHERRVSEHVSDPISHR